MKKKRRTRYIYVIKNTVNGKLYVGQSVDPKHRFWSHKNDAIKGTKKLVLHRAMMKYGFDSFTYTVIDKKYSINSINKAEAYWIRQLKTLTSQNGYNVSPGGDQKDMPESIRQQISNTLKGRSCSPETEFKPGHIMPRGEDSTSSKLRNANVQEIKILIRDQSVWQKDIAKLYGVGQSIISFIANEKKWTHIVISPTDRISNPSKALLAAIRKKQRQDIHHHNPINRKLTLKQARVIRKSTKPVYWLVAKYGITQSCIWNIQHNKTYKG